MRALAVALVAFCAAPSVALAGLDSPPALPDLSAYVTAATLANQLNAITAAVPIASSDIAAAPVVGGAVGTAGIYVPATAAPKLIVQAANATTDGSGVWSVTFAQMFASSSPIVLPIAMASPSATQPITCVVTARSSSAASGKCFSGATTLLNLSILGTGLTLNPNLTAPASTPVMIIAREPTQ